MANSQARHHFCHWHFWHSLSLYHWLLQITWPRFFALVVATYLALNIFFASALLLTGPGALTGAAPGGEFWRAFFFSVETFGTIGYGNIAPLSVAAHVLMTLEAVTGLLGIASITGILFAPFSHRYRESSRPTCDSLVYGDSLFLRHFATQFPLARDTRSRTDDTRSSGCLNA